MKLESVLAHENLLKDAMLNSDVTALSALLADDLIFTNHLGHIMTKSDDLEAHRSGFVCIDTIDVTEQAVTVFGDTAVVTNRTAITGIFGAVKADSVLRFTRIWHSQENDTLQLVVAQSTAITENSV